MDAALRIDQGSVSKLGEVLGVVPESDVSHIGVLDYYSAMLRRNPDTVDEWVQTGRDLRTEGHLDQALVCIQRALRLAPHAAAIWSEQGDLWLAMSQHVQALRAHRLAVEFAPEKVRYRVAYARALRMTERYREALDVLVDCALCDPQRRDVKHERGLNHLALADYRRAWPDLETRQLHPLLEESRLSAPRWRGECIGARRLLLVAERDEAETLWALRYVQLLARRGADLHLACCSSLGPLMRQLPLTVWRVDDPALLAERFDFCAALGSLPGIQDCNGLTLPQPAALSAPEESVAAIEALLMPDPRVMRVGLAIDARAYDTGVCAELLALAQVRGVELYALQAGVMTPATSNVTPITDLAARCADHGDLAAAIDAMDLVIADENAVAHLAGALYKPTVMLLGHSPHWIYGRTGDATASYATLKLLRPDADGGRESMMRELNRLVKNWASQRQETTTYG